MGRHARTNRDLKDRWWLWHLINSHQYYYIEILFPQLLTAGTNEIHRVTKPLVVTNSYYTAVTTDIFSQDLSLMTVHGRDHCSINSSFSAFVSIVITSSLSLSHSLSLIAYKSTNRQEHTGRRMHARTNFALCKVNAHDDCCKYVMYHPRVNL